jgi:NTP pyrophosphatase (non-canonical NTP hydrolase)
MTYYLYHIPGKKIGVTQNLEERVHKQQGYYPGEYDVIEKSDDIDFISMGEQIMQRHYGYKVDEVPYNKLKFNNMKMKINVTEQTTTFPCPVNKLKGQLMDNMGMKWETEFGDCVVTAQSIDWIMKNAKTSMYNDERSYVYNKAFARWFENNDAFNLDNAAQMNLMDQYNGRTIAGALSPISNNLSQFDLIREWANERGLYKGGDSKTQALKLVEEVGETCKAILKSDEPEIIDGIGDCVVVLTNLAELIGTPIEDCIAAAYNEIKGRTGKMDNGTFKKD